MGRPKNKDPRTKYGNSIKDSTIKEIKQIAFNTSTNENEVIESAIYFYSKVQKTKKHAENHGITFEKFLDEALTEHLLKLSNGKFKG